MTLEERKELVWQYIEPILDQLSDLDASTLRCDPSTAKGRAELDRIRAVMEELEADLHRCRSDIRNLERQETL